MKVKKRIVFIAIFILIFLVSFLFALTKTEENLFNAVYMGDTNSIYKLLSVNTNTNTLNINSKDDEGYTALHRAVYYNKLDSLKALLKSTNINIESTLPYNTKINNWYIGGSTPLILASYFGYPDIVSFLIDNNANIRARDSIDGSMPIHVASANGHTNVLYILLKKDETLINEKDYKGNYPLHWAAMKDKADTVKFLINNGADIGAFDKDGWTPLHYAAAFASINTVRALVDMGANLQDKTYDGNVPSYYARKPDVLIYLENAMKNTNSIINTNTVVIVDDYITNNYITNNYITNNYITNSSTPYSVRENDIELQQTELMLAVKNGDIITINNLISKGLDINFTDEEGYSPIHRAIFYNKINSLESLLKARNANTEIRLPEGTDINGWYLDGATPLLLASYLGYADMANMLLNKGADIKAKDFVDGASSIHIAVANGNNDVVMLLLNRDKTIINSKDDTATTPLSWASMKGKSDTVSLLLQSGADIKLKDNDGNTVLHYAVLYGNLDTIKAILDFNAKDVVNIKDYNGNTALQLAAIQGNDDFISVLVEAGANINLTSDEGYSALHYAAMNGNFNSVQLLISLNADKTVKDKYNGYTAADVAKNYGYYDIAEYLKVSSGTIVKDMNEKLPMPEYKKPDMSKKWWKPF